MEKHCKGFSLIELVVVLVLVGILAATATVGVLPSSSFQLQASRDQVVAAFFSAQQRAMAQTNPVRVVLTSPTTVDVQEDGGSGFSSIRLGGTQYPISLLANQSISSGTFLFDRLGKTSSSTLTLSQSGDNVSITVHATGFVE